MSEVLPSGIISENSVILEQMCQNIKRLYPGIDEIQFFEDKGRHISFWIITRNNSVDLDSFHGVQQSILTEFGRNHRGLRCSVHNIRQVSVGDITSQNEIGNRYVSEIESRIKLVFPRDDIHVCYENSEFVVYGLAPRDQGRMHAEILSIIPHTLPCIMQFRAGAEWANGRDVATTIRGTNAAVASVDVSSRVSPFSGFMLSIERIREILLGRISPPK